MPSVPWPVALSGSSCSSGPYGHEFFFSGVFIMKIFHLKNFIRKFLISFNLLILNELEIRYGQLIDLGHGFSVILCMVSFRDT